MKVAVFISHHMYMVMYHQNVLNDWMKYKIYSC